MNVSVAAFGPEDDKGVRKRIAVYGKTEREVERKLRRLLRQPGASIDAEKLPLADFLISWLRSVKGNNRPLDL